MNNEVIRLNKNILSSSAVLNQNHDNNEIHYTVNNSIIKQQNSLTIKKQQINNEFLDNLRIIKVKKKSTAKAKKGRRIKKKKYDSNTPFAYDVKSSSESNRCKDNSHELSNIISSLKKEKTHLNHTVCKICLEQECIKELISPCLCQGTMQYIHESCLKKWIINNYSALDEAVCEICKYKYIIQKTENSEFCSEKACKFLKSTLLIFLIYLFFSSISILICYVICLMILKNDKDILDKVFYGISIFVIFLMIFLFFFRDLKKNCYKINEIEWFIKNKNPEN